MTAFLEFLFLLAFGRRYKRSYPRTIPDLGESLITSRTPFPERYFTTHYYKRHPRPQIASRQPRHDTTPLHHWRPDSFLKPQSIFRVGRRKASHGATSANLETGTATREQRQRAAWITDISSSALERFLHLP